jgi:hypothetical protein
MNATFKHPKLEKFWRYFEAYAWYVFFILFGLLITWCLRSDILLLCIAWNTPEWITNILNNWGTFIIFTPFILVVAGLESYMNQAARKSVVRKSALKVLAIEGGIGLLVFLVMGILAFSGYQPTI